MRSPPEKENHQKDECEKEQQKESPNDGKRTASNRDLVVRVVGREMERAEEKPQIFEEDERGTKPSLDEWKMCKGIVKHERLR